MTAVVSTEVRVTVGVDTHADVHVAAALDQFGRLLATQLVPSTPAGYRALVAWANTLGTVERFGIEGTSSYGAGLSRWLRRRAVEVLEVERPKRQNRRRHTSPMRSMPKRLHARCRLERRPPSPKLAMVRSKCCVCSRQLADRPSRHALRPPTSCTLSSSPPRIASALVCAGSAGRG
jgi:transposase